MEQFKKTETIKKNKKIENKFYGQKIINNLLLQINNESESNNLYSDSWDKYADWDRSYQ